jgi:hypothetical protein
MRFPNMYDTASTPGIETGPAAWELSIIPRRHNDIHLKKAGITIIYAANFSLQPILTKVSIMAYKNPDYMIQRRSRGTKTNTAYVMLHF